MTGHVYRVRDAEDSAYDFFILDLEERASDEVERLIDTAISEALAADPDEYTWDNVVERLAPHGFAAVDIYETTTRF